MAGLRTRYEFRRRVHRRIRKKVAGTGARPRLAVFRSNKNIYAQLIDDHSGLTLASAASNEAEAKKGLSSGGNVEAAKMVGRLIAERAKQRGWVVSFSIAVDIFTMAGFKRSRSRLARRD